MGVERSGRRPQDRPWGSDTAALPEAQGPSDRAGPGPNTPISLARVSYSKNFNTCCNPQTMAVGYLNGANGADPAAQKLWTHPSPQSTPLHAFLQHINKKYHLQLKSYQDLYTWSVENIAAFWGDVWHYVGIKASQPYEEVTNLLIRRHSLPANWPCRSSTRPRPCSRARPSSAEPN